MRLEIYSAADFLCHLLRLHNNGLTESQLENFRMSLANLLRIRYRDHWFPDRPNRGSGYRCLRINGKMDPVIAQAGAAVGLPGQYLHSLFPSELTMWIDPSEVSYRIGENGSICVLYNSVQQQKKESNDVFLNHRLVEPSFTNCLSSWRHFIQVASPSHIFPPCPDNV